MLLQTLEEHCRGLFDFLYLPVDFRNQCNVGYCFVNMTGPEGVVRLYEALHNRRWARFNSDKICLICFARKCPPRWLGSSLPPCPVVCTRPAACEPTNSPSVCRATHAGIQGRDALVRHFKNSSLLHEDHQFRQDSEASCPGPLSCCTPSSSSSSPPCACWFSGWLRLACGTGGWLLW